MPKFWTCLIFVLFLDIYDCFKIKNFHYINTHPLYRNCYIKKCNTLHKRYYNSRTYQIKNVQEHNEETNKFDDTYIYHTPVLLTEVIYYMMKDEENSSVSSFDQNLNDNKDTKCDSNTINTINDNSINSSKCQGSILEKTWCHLNNNMNTSSTNIKNSSSLYEKKKKECIEESIEKPNSKSANNLCKNSYTTNHNNEQVNYYIDATLGGGGHTLEILNKISNCKIIGIDKDIEALYYNKIKLKTYINNNKLKLIHGDYGNILHLLHLHSLPIFNYYNGILIDLGVSSHQLKCSDRGFSYKYNGILDMNMNKYTESQYLSKLYRNDNEHINDINDIKKKKKNSYNKLHNILNTYSLKKLKFIIDTYGEEKKALKIAKKIIQWRKENGNILTTFQLKNIILSTCKQNYKSNNKVLSRVFQAFRIYINQELKALKQLLISSHKLLKTGKKLIVITYHSLEKKCVELFIEKNKQKWTKIHQNAIIPSDEEIKLNKSARSAKMFIYKKN
ncbi:S-adenosyl-methyltransferase, putative [Plasmodium sp. gorilla clade G3]|nr:S-adenosyl-methyltransferase, putative [Plasmodium sp. gorilla clade G3]